MGGTCCQQSPPQTMELNVDANGSRPSGVKAALKAEAPVDGTLKKRNSVTLNTESQMPESRRSNRRKPTGFVFKGQVPPEDEEDEDEEE
mmetsp:Transcript_7754/g.14153  ORF Transcript_7754/g.14153 Transcript_7754/m.14153 type:complete len:89 (+) Transcript_7754:170-436(+)